MGSSNSLIGFLNFLSLLLSLPILAGAIWLSSRAAATECLRFLQWPLIVISISIITVSLAGFAGTCYRHTSLVYCYLWAMFPVIAALLAFVVFAYAVTRRGSGRALMGRAYMDYSLRDYDGNSWLADHVTGERDWERISACVRDSHVCQKMIGRSGAYEAETAEMFYMRKLTPIEVSRVVANHPHHVGSHMSTRPRGYPKADPRGLTRTARDGATIKNSYVTTATRARPAF